MSIVRAVFLLLLALDKEDKDLLFIFMDREDKEDKEDKDPDG